MMTGARWIDLGLALLVSALLAATAWLVPAGGGLELPWGKNFPAVCWLNQVTGVECPFCGMTRSWVAAMHGDLASSFGWHPGGPLLLAAGIVLLLGVGISMALRRPPLWGRRGFVTSLTLVSCVCFVAGLVRPLW